MEPQLWHQYPAYHAISFGAKVIGVLLNMYDVYVLVDKRHNLRTSSRGRQNIMQSPSYGTNTQSTIPTVFGAGGIGVLTRDVLVEPITIACWIQ